MEKLQELLEEMESIRGFEGIGVFTPEGDLIASHVVEGLPIEELGVDVNDLLFSAQTMTKDMGMARGSLLHVQSDDAHFFATCFNEGSDPLKSAPGKSHFHTILIIDPEGSVGMARLKLTQFALKAKNHLL